MATNRHRFHENSVSLDINHLGIILIRSDQPGLTDSLILEILENTNFTEVQRFFKDQIVYVDLFDLFD